MASRKRKRAKLEAPVLSPRFIIDVEDDTFGFYWPGLAVRASEQAKKAGKGVFATKELPAGTKIPILGRATTEEEFKDLEERHKDTHVFGINGKEYPYVNGDPKIEPFHGVGGNGLYIAMMINEPSRKKPNCIFKGNFVQIAQTLQAGQELTISYGAGYRRVGYKVSQYCRRKCVYDELKKFK